MTMIADVKTVLASAARTVTGSVDIGGNYGDFNIYINVTAVAGTSPSMTVAYQCGPDNITFFDHTTATAFTAAGKQMLKIATNHGKFGRITYTISGTSPSFTFSVITESVCQ